MNKMSKFCYRSGSCHTVTEQFKLMTASYASQLYKKHTAEPLHAGYNSTCGKWSYRDGFHVFACEVKAATQTMISNVFEKCWKGRLKKSCWSRKENSVSFSAVRTKIEHMHVAFAFH